MKPKSKIPIVIILIFVGLFILLRLPSLFEPYWYGDEGIYLVLGQAIRKGRALYSQIHDNKPPALYYLASIVRTVFGFRFLLTLVMVPTIYYFYRLSLKFLSTKKAILSSFLFLILTSIPFLEGNIANAEVFMLLPTILAFLIYKPDNFFNLFLSGFLLGLAFTFKVSVSIELSALVFFSFCFFVVSFFKKPSLKKIFPVILKICLLSISFFVPILLLAFYYWYKQNLADFLFASLFQNFSYLSSWKTGSHSGSATQGGILSRAIVLITFWLFCLFLYLKKKIKPNNILLLVWFSSTVFGALLSTRPYPHYLIQILPPVCILFFNLFQSKKITSNLSKAISIFVISLSILFFRYYNFYTYPTLSYYKTFYTNLNKPSVFKNFFGSHVAQNQQIVDYLSPRLTVTDNIFIWGDSPYIYTLLDKLPTYKYVVAYHIVDFDGYDDLIFNLKSFLPKFIIYYPMPNRPFPKLDDIISKYYFLDNKVNSISIYQKR